MSSMIKFTQLNTQRQLCVSFLLTAFSFAVPISESARSVFLGLAIALIVLTPSYRKDLISQLSQRWCQALLLFFLIVLLACAWSPASVHQKISVLHKYIKLLFLPVLVIGFRDPRIRRFGLYAFVAAMFVTCLGSMLKASGLLTYHGPNPGDVFRNHIMTGFMMSFATYLTALFFIREHGRVRFLYATLTLLFSYQILFINTGRTGRVVYVLLMLLLMVQSLSWRRVLLALVMSSTLLSVSYYQNPALQSVIDQRVAKVLTYHQEVKNDPIGWRIQFHAYAKKLFLKHPWFGNGTASYNYFFRKEDPVPSWHYGRVSTKQKLFEPHSQYWLVADEFGLLGILALLFFFGSLLVASLQLKSMRMLAIASILAFMIGSLSDSILFYSGTGYFFLLFMGICLGESHSVGNGPAHQVKDSSIPALAVGV